MADKAGSSKGWPGDQDPTALTASAVTQAKDDLRREIQALRELLEAQIATVTAELHQTWALHNADVERERTERAALREVVFDKFGERDLRFGQQDQARKDALEMALRTARELVDTKADAAQAAADKFQEAIVRQLEESTRTNSEARDRLATQISELEKRQDRDAGSKTGVAEAQAITDRQASTRLVAVGVAISLVVVIVNVIFFALTH
jgi:hypothetical protein